MFNSTFLLWHITYGWCSIHGLAINSLEILIISLDSTLTFLSIHLRSSAHINFILRKCSNFLRPYWASLLDSSAGVSLSTQCLKLNTCPSPKSPLLAIFFLTVVSWILLSRQNLRAGFIFSFSSQTYYILIFLNIFESVPLFSFLLSYFSSGLLSFFLIATVARSMSFVCLFIYLLIYYVFCLFSCLLFS